MKLIAADMDRRLGVRDTAALFLPEEFHKGSGLPVPPAFSFIKDRINLGYFKAKIGETLFVPFGDMPAVIVAGLGKKGEITAESLRNSAGAAVDVCRRKRISTLHVFVPEIEKLSEVSAIGPLAEGLSLANYAFNRYKSKGEDTVETVDTAVFHVKAVPGTRRLLAEISSMKQATSPIPSPSPVRRSG
jgi:leucyl aminopeptidase